MLRPFDRSSLYSTDTVEILLPETGLDSAMRLATSLAGGAELLLGGISVFPDRARSADELIEQARLLLLKATARDPILAQHGPSQETIKEPLLSGMVIASPAMEKLLKTATKLSTSVIPVLILGETGTGKELVARSIHNNGPRGRHPLVSVNCGSIPAQLVESTLFGHEKGAFTGATQQQKGIFESADSGSVLLDEIGELPLGAQAALLRVLETKRFCRVGTSREVEVDVRVLASTHRDLEQMCSEGAFRDDLFYRLNAMTIRVPPLRDRPEEIEPLCQFFMKQAAASNRCKEKNIESDTFEVLRSYQWPGNVRELRNAIERAVVIAAGDQITPDDLPERVRNMSPSHTRNGQDECAAPETVCGDFEINLRQKVDRYEADLILKVLEQCRWDRKLAATSLGLPIRTLSHKMQQYGITRG